MITLNELVKRLHGFPRDAAVELAVIESVNPPHQPVLALFVRHGDGGTCVISAPLDLSGLPSQSPGAN